MDDAERRCLRALALALWAFAGLNAADLALTLWGLAHGLTEGAPAASRVVARLGPLGLVALKVAIVGGTWALTWPLARRYPAQLARPLAWIVAVCCFPVLAAVALDIVALDIVALDIVALDGWRGW